MSDLERRVLGRTGLVAGVLGFGAMELRGEGHNRGRALEAGQAERVLNGVLDAGINFVDTSPDYGESEENIGRSISHRRDEFILASKCGCPLDPPADAPRPLPHVFTRENIVGAVEQSLRRMNTDHIDVLQLHQSPSKDVLARDQAIETLVDLRSQGKIRFIGSSSTLPNLADHIALGVFDEFQIPYSALQREHEALMAEAAEAGAGIVVRGGVARGEPGRGQGRAETWDQWEAAGLDDLLDGMARTEFMLRFTITNPAVTTTIVGTLNPQHLAANVAAASAGPLPADLYAEARRRLDAATPTA